MKLPIFLVLALLLIAIPASAFSFLPFPINGKLIGENPGGLEIAVTNVRTGETMTTTANKYGEWLIDWANSEKSYGEGDYFRIEVLECSMEDCVLEVQYIGGPELHVEMPFVRDIPCPEQLSCPDYPICPTCPICEDPESCPAPKTQGITEIIVGILALVAGMGGGMKIYKNRLGKVTFQHRHKGIKNYHDVNVSHMNSLYRHARFRDDPLKFTKDVARINGEEV